MKGRRDFTPHLYTDSDRPAVVHPCRMEEDRVREFTVETWESKRVGKKRKRVRPYSYTTTTQPKQRHSRVPIVRHPTVSLFYFPWTRGPTRPPRLVEIGGLVIMELEHTPIFTRKIEQIPSQYNQRNFCRFDYRISYEGKRSPPGTAWEETKTTRSEKTRHRRLSKRTRRKTYNRYKLTKKRST